MMASITITADWVQKVIKADQELFLLLNKGYTNSFLDSLYPWYREGNTWVPFYLFLVVFAILNFGKKAFPFILFAVVTIVLTDQISSSMVKPFFERPRPCRDPLLMNQIRMLLNRCSGGYSFTSSHATNHFGFAVYLFVTIGSLIGKWKYFLLFWAATIAYGQVYVGVHYPLDIFFGALLGAFIGWGTGYWHNRISGTIHPGEMYKSI
ncbi:phosphatase PAP2 family protein [Sediminibacterium salmoneum]|uniref:phosphatase PAP2 family protein n=1 Tax=Sediminibacterium salmoneum TaxID=426421 RepID=UPI00068581E0|nr:phosphatase PAP2 family protein [Sediminibacterium salmoneum]